MSTLKEARPLSTAQSPETAFDRPIARVEGPVCGSLALLLRRAERPFGCRLLESPWCGERSAVSAGGARPVTAAVVAASGGAL